MSLGLKEMLEYICCTGEVEHYDPGPAIMPSPQQQYMQLCKDAGSDRVPVGLYEERCVHFAVACGKLAACACAHITPPWPAWLRKIKMNYTTEEHLGGTLSVYDDGAFRRLGLPGWHTDDTLRVAVQHYMSMFFQCWRDSNYVRNNATCQTIRAALLDV